MTAGANQIELDSGPRSRAPERLCVATRTVRPIAEMIRFVIGPEGEATPDLRQRLPGRGVWVTATRDALTDAVKRKALSRGFKREVRLPSDLVARTDRLLERAVLEALAMAGKAGLVASGFSRVAAAVAENDLVGLVHAAEAAPDGVRKLDAALRRRPAGRPVATIGIFTAAQLDLALGRPNVIHAALLAGPASETVLARLRRLERFRSGEPPAPAGIAAVALANT